MTVRTSRKSVTFTRPFSLSGIDEVQAAGTYTVETDEQLLPDVSFPAWRRIATLIFLPSRPGGVFVEQVVSIDPLELAAAQERDAGGPPLPNTTAAISTRTTGGRSNDGDGRCAGGRDLPIQGAASRGLIAPARPAI